MIKDKVAIVGVSQTKFSVSRHDVSMGEMIWEVIEKLVNDLGLKFEAQERNDNDPYIDKIVSCSEDYWQGRTISDCYYHLEMGALGMSLTKVAADGAFAVYHGAINILSGKNEIVLSWHIERSLKQSRALWKTRRLIQFTFVP